MNEWTLNEMGNILLAMWTDEMLLFIFEHQVDDCEHTMYMIVALRGAGIVLVLSTCEQE